MESEIKQYMKELGASSRRSPFNDTLCYVLNTDFGLCNVQIRLSEYVMLVNFIERPYMVQSVFGKSKVDMVGSQQDFFTEIKEHFEFIFDTIEKEFVSLQQN